MSGLVCICEGNWRELVAETAGLYGNEYTGPDGLVYRFIGLINGEEDYYYGLTDGFGRLARVSCVGSLEAAGFFPSDVVEPLPDFLQPGEDSGRMEVLRRRALKDPAIAWLLEKYNELDNEKMLSFADAYGRAIDAEAMEPSATVDAAVPADHEAEYREFYDSIIERAKDPEMCRIFWDRGIRKGLEKFEAAFTDARDQILHGRGAVDGMLDSDQTNVVLGVMDEMYEATHGTAATQESNQ